MWVRLEDDFFDHPKVKRLPRLAALFHIEKMCYSGRWLTDGRIPKVEARGKREAGYADTLVAAGIWHRAKDLKTVCSDCWRMVGENPGDGWVIHHFLRYNPSKTEVETRRSHDRFRKAQPKESMEKPEGVQTESEGNPRARTYGTNDTRGTALPNLRPIPSVSQAEIRAEATRTYGRPLARGELA